MITVDIYRTVMPIEKTDEIVCSLAWDKKRKRITVLKGKSFARKLFQDKILDKKVLKEKKRFEYISFRDGKRFLTRLENALTGHYIYAVRKK